MLLPDIIRFVKSANNRCNFFSNLWCKLPCFSTAFQKKSACKFLCPAKLHFSCKTAHKFFERVTSCNRITTNVVAKLWCKFLCFSTAFQKDSACKFLCPATLHFSYKRVHKFLDVFAFSNRITTNVVAKLWRKFLCFSTAFQKGSAGKFLCPATLNFSNKRAHKFFERACFQQPYYDKRCCEICYLLPKIGNFTKKIAKKYLKPLTVFGD